MSSLFTLTLLLVTQVTGGRIPNNLGLRASEIIAPDDYSAPAEISDFNLTIFNQLIDHSNPSLGTFEQRVYSNDKYWAGPGSPVVMFTPGEDDASTYPNYLTNRKITGKMAEEIGGAVVMIEHRYWGESSPYDQLTVENLKHLTLNNSILDFINVANNVQLPFDPTNSSQAGVAPWVYAGGSYGGSLAVWTQTTNPGTYWAYYATSAPVQHLFDQWSYFDPVIHGMPANCSKDVQLVTEHITSVLSSGDKANITALKTMFGAEGIEHDDDFASIFLDGPFLWQSISYNYSMGYNSFDTWCDYVETAASPGEAVPDASGVGLEKALAGYSNWSKTVDIPGTCAGYGYPEWSSDSSLGCFNSHNATSPFYTDLNVNNTGSRQWMWFLCSEFAGWQVGAGTPADTPTIVPRYLHYDFDINMCNLLFPTSSDGKTTYNDAFVNSNYSEDAFQSELDTLDSWTKGWDIEGLTERVIFVVGEDDPWQSMSVVSPLRPGGPLNSTASQPIISIKGGRHTSDMEMANGKVNADIAAAQNATIAQIKTWVSEFSKN